MRFKGFTLFTLLVLLGGMVATPAYASYGKISGVVKDAQSGETLPGANVTVQVGGATLGATTDTDGRYFILNVTPGVYDVKGTFVGYQVVTQTDVKISLDLTTEVHFALQSQAIAQDEMVVVAERPAVEKTQTSSRTSINAAELNNTMPVADLQDLVDTAPSSYRGFIRGGRKSETKIIVDGIDISDTYFRAGEGVGVYSPYTASNRSTGGEYGAVGVNASSVQSLDVISGTFNAEYDAASAGIINVVTKEGGPNYQGRLFARVQPGGVKNPGPDVYNDIDDYNAERASLLASGDPDKERKGALYDFNLSDVDYGDKTTVESEFSLGGPLSDKGGFYFTTRFTNDRGLFPNQKSTNARYSLKVHNRVTENAKLTGSLMIDDGGKLGGWVNRDFSSTFKFFPEGYVGNKKLGSMGYLALTHTLSPNTFYEVRVSQLNKSSELGYSDDNGDGKVSIDEDGDFIVIDTPQESELYLGLQGSSVDAAGNFTFFASDPGNESFHRVEYSQNQYRIGQPGFFYDKTDRNVFQIKADLTSQVNYNNQFKAGVLYRYHSVSQFQQRTQVRVIFDNQFPFETTDWSLNPQEFAVYAQDRIEYAGIIINAGLRLDGFDVGAKNFTDFFDPSNQTTAANGQIVREQVRGADVDVKWFIQPRLGVSHPVGERAALHYSWGKFYSPPPFSQVLDGFGVFSNPSLPFVVDVDSDPSEATAYEIGLQVGLTSEYIVGLTAYIRDIENYSRIGFSINPDQANSPGFGSYTYNTSFGYADSRGIELNIEKRPGNFPVSGRLGYAFSYIKASAFSRDTPFPDQTSFDSRSDTSIPFDDKDQFNTFEINVSGGGNALVSGFDREHRLSLSLIAQFPGQVNLSLISQAESGFNFRVIDTTDDLRSRETDRGPWSLQTDVRLTKSIAFADKYTGSLFLEARNIFDRENILTFDTSLAADRANWEQSVKDGEPDPTGTLNRAFTREGVSLYDIPRAVNVGVAIDF